MLHALQAQMEPGHYHIVVDLDFDAHMDDSARRSLVQQLNYAHSANTNAPTPAHLHLTSYAGAAHLGPGGGCHGIESQIQAEP
jgi:hypothetical protein